jgi:hypothetical protein
VSREVCPTVFIIKVKSAWPVEKPLLSESSR